MEKNSCKNKTKTKKGITFIVIQTILMWTKKGYLVVNYPRIVGGLVHIGDFNGIFVGASRPLK